MFFRDYFCLDRLLGFPFEVTAIYTEKGIVYVGVNEFKPPKFITSTPKLINLSHLILRQQLEEYFRGKRKIFDLQLDLRTTDYRRKVYNALLAIPYGEVRTYKQVACSLGVPNGQRAVGQALKANPLPIIIPCHRVVAESGLGGFSLGTELKEALLELEKNSLRPNNSNEVALAE